jgi:hypothetical protein
LGKGGKMNMYLLYIDPGTGSALFSIIIGAAATIYFLGRALILKLKVIFSGGKTTNAASVEHPFVIYCEGKQYWQYPGEAGKRIFDFMSEIVK